ncbi:hypothetical protein SAMN05443634_1244, partial [Chishuiella changwenlii]
IIYFLPSNVSNIFIKEIKDNDNNYFILDKEDSDTYIIYLDNSIENFWVKHTNRAVFLNGKLIPLYFVYDEYFSFAEEGKDVLKKLGTEDSIHKVSYIRDNVFNVKFNLNGEIVK